MESKAQSSGYPDSDSKVETENSPFAAAIILCRDRSGQFEIINPFKNIGVTSDTGVDALLSADSSMYGQMFQDSYAACVVVLEHVKALIQFGSGVDLETFRQSRAAFLRAYESYLAAQALHPDQSFSSAAHRDMFCAAVALLQEPTQLQYGAHKNVYAPIALLPIGHAPQLVALMTGLSTLAWDMLPYEAVAKRRTDDWSQVVGIKEAVVDALADTTAQAELFGKPMAIWMSRNAASVEELHAERQQIEDLRQDPTFDPRCKNMLPTFYPDQVTRDYYQRCRGDAEPLPATAIGIEYLARDLSGQRKGERRVAQSETQLRASTAAMIDVIDFVTALNARGLFLFDLKPENIRLSERGQVMFSDLGSLVEAEGEPGDYHLPSDGVEIAENHGLQVMEGMKQGRVAIESIDPIMVQTNAVAVLALDVMCRQLGDAEKIFRRDPSLPLAQKINNLLEYVSIENQVIPADVFGWFRQFLLALQTYESTSQANNQLIMLKQLCMDVSGNKL